MAPKADHRFHCVDCDRVTKHAIIFTYDFEEEVDLKSHGMKSNLFLDHEFMIIQCGGCDNVSFVDAIPVIGDVHQYPEPVKKDLQGLFLQSHELKKVPKEISGLYEEVSITLRHSASILAGIGLRTLVEAICLQQKIEGYNLQIKIKELLTHGLISKQEEPILDKLRTIGNAAAHKIKAVDADSLRHALLIVNHILRSIYILPGLGGKIKI